MEDLVKNLGWSIILERKKGDRQYVVPILENTSKGQQELTSVNVYRIPESCLHW